MKKTMQAVVFEGEGDIRIKNVPKPGIINKDDVLLKVEAASICGSDIQVAKVPSGHPATKGVILGHEYVGIVEDVGDAVKAFAKGDRVVVEPNIYCGSCYYCKSGLPNMCESIIGTGFYTNGGFAEYSVMPCRALHKVREDVPAEVAVFTEPLGCVLNSLSKLNIQIGDNVAVLGAGPVALLFIKAIKASGAAKLIVSEKMRMRQEIARQCGALVVDPTEKDTASFVMQETGIGADIVIDCVGGLLNEAVACVRKAGKVLLFGLNSNARNTINPYDITHDEINIIGGFVIKYTFKKALYVLEQHIVEVADLITHRYRFKDFNEAVKVINEGKAVKVILEP